MGQFQILETWIKIVAKEKKRAVLCQNTLCKSLIFTINILGIITSHYLYSNFYMYVHKYNVF